MVLRTMSTSPARTINLLKGYPSPSLLPASLLSAASQRVLANPATATPALLYGADEGFWRLRQNLAKWLDEFYGRVRRSYVRQHSGVDDQHFVAEDAASRITITGGASQSLAVILSTFTDPDYTQTVWMAVPAYYLASKIFQDAGLAGRLRPVPEDDEGVNVDELEARLTEAQRDHSQQRHGAWKGHKPASIYEKVYRHVIYVVPTFANPSSRTTSLGRRERLVEVARKFDALIVCDDVYDMLQWPRSKAETSENTDEAQLPRVVDVDRHLAPEPGEQAWGNAISNGSFSKILGPGIRTGWVEAAPKFAFRLSQTGAQKSGGAPSQFAAVCVNDLLERQQLQRHVRETLRVDYERRWTLMRDAIRAELEPLGVVVVEQAPRQGSKGLAGGYFIWVTLPEPLRGLEVAEKAKSLGLTVAHGEMFEIPSLPEHEASELHQDLNSTAPSFPSEAPSTDYFPRSLRLCFSYEDESLLGQGISVLAQTIKMYVGGS